MKLAFWRKEEERLRAPVWGPDLSFGFGGQQYPLLGGGTMPGAKQHPIDDNFVGMVEGVHNRFGVVAAAVYTRALLLSQVRFQYRNQATGRLFGNRSLGALEEPAVMCRPDLLTLAEHHVSYAGNAFFYRDAAGVRLLRPDWMQVVIGSPRDTDVKDPGGLIDARVVGYMYTENGDPERVQPLDPGAVAHWKPEPSPLNPWIGQSWVSSLLRELSMDAQASEHMGNFFENGATPNVIHTFPQGVPAENVEETIELFKREQGGAENAYKTLFLMAGADTKVVGTTPEGLALREIHGHIETRVASRARVPAVVLGIREGMQGSALNSGNYGQTRRQFADGWFTPTIQNLCACLQPLVDTPADSELWYDPTMVLFLQEDQMDRAEIMQAQAAAARQFIDAGWDADAVVAAIEGDDLSLLEGQHTGLTSVQLLPPAGNEPAPEPDRSGELIDAVLRVSRSSADADDEYRKRLDELEAKLATGWDVETDTYGNLRSLRRAQ